MIVGTRKPLEEIKAMISPYKKILIVGCGTCVAVCLAGGEKEVEVLKNELSLSMGDKISFEGVTLERQCDKEFLDQLADVAGQYDAFLSMACGVGVQFLSEVYPEKPVFPALNTTFMGLNRAVGWYEERCRGCGNCMLGITGGICPVTMCAKSLFNGPCGGTNKGKCEIDEEQPCAWYLIYERLEKQGRLDQIMDVVPANNWENQRPRTVIQPGYENLYKTSK
ncbi:methylenetetrahydrofolate reductase C-terminal domain-containing protein [Desulfothermus okinawensis JCM 13304]